MWNSISDTAFALGLSVTIRHSAKPLALLLAVLDYALDLFAGVGDGHFVDEEAELYLHPLVAGGVIYPVADCYNTHAAVTQVLKLHQTLAVAAGETAEVLDHKYLVFAANKLSAHYLIELALVEGVARAVSVRVECKLRFRELCPHIVLDYGFLVLNRGVVPVEFLVYRYSAVAGYAENG